MTDLADPRTSLSILHVLRAPLGGLFRHVLDLSREQVARGHRVGLIVDSTTGNEMAARALRELEPRLALGLFRFPMRRNPHPGDIAALARVVAATRRLKPDVVHGHGSKGGLYARLPGLASPRKGPVRVYTPHGGSFHYRPGTAIHAAYMAAEYLLGRSSDLVLFESAYIADRYRAFVGEPPRLSRVAVNGLADSEFAPVPPDPDAADFLYVGELRAAKGIDLLLEALAATRDATHRRIRAVLVGSGPDRQALQAQAARLGLAGDVVFRGAMPIRDAFRLGRVLVIPSRAESLPYVVLEAAAARVPLVATAVGGIPEIFGPYRDCLVPGGDVTALRTRMIEQLAVSPEQQVLHALALASHVRSQFCLGTMVDHVLEGYRDAIASKTLAATAMPLPRVLDPFGSSV